MPKNIEATLTIGDNCYELDVSNAKSDAAVRQGIRDQLSGPPDDILELPLDDGGTLMILRSELRRGHFVIMS